MTDTELAAGIRVREASWERLDRKSDPRGEYTRRQDLLLEEIQLMQSIQAERELS